MSTDKIPIGLIHKNDNRWSGNTLDSSGNGELIVVFVDKISHPSIEIFNLCAWTAPEAIAACVPNDIQPDIMAPAIAPKIAPLLLLHGMSMPNVKTPNVVPAAIADNDVANYNKWWKKQKNMKIENWIIKIVFVDDKCLNSYL